MKRVLAYLAWAGLMAVLGFSYEYHVPRLKTWILVTIEAQTAKSLPVRVFPGEIGFHLFPVGVSLYKIRVLPKPELQHELSPVGIDELRVDLHIWQLLSGRLRIQEVTVVHPVFSAMVDTLSQSSNPPSIEEILNFDQMLGVPIDRITVVRANVDIAISKPELIIHARQLATSLSRGRNALALQLIAPHIAIQQNEIQTEVSFSARGGLRLTADEFQISDLHIKKGKSIMRLNGQVDGDITQFKFEKLSQPINIKVQSLLDLEDLSHWAKETFPKLMIPPTTGHVRTDLLVSQKKHSPVEVSGSIDGRELIVDRFVIGRFETEGRLHEQQILLQKVMVESDSGRAELHGAELNLNEGLNFKFTAATQNLNLHNLLKNVRVGEVPVELAIAAELPCQGLLRPAPVLKCSGNLSSQNLQVWGDRDRKHLIVAYKKVDGTGEVTVTDKDVQFKGRLKSEFSDGETSGVVSYASGFQISYRAPHFDFRDLQNLVNLKLEGQAQLEGSTQGHAKAATFNIDVNANNLWFQDFLLGTAAAKISYKSGSLFFHDIRGQINNSHYNGSVSFDIPNEQLQVSATAPVVDARDLIAAFARKVQLPITATGTGSAQIRLSGPPRFNALTYTLKSSLLKGTVAGESFDKLNFDVKADAGEVRAEQVYMNKGHGTVTLNGAGHPDGNIEVRIAGRNFRLEDSENVSRLAPTINGDVEFDMNMKGYVLLPDTVLMGHVKEALLGETPLGSSDFRLRIAKRTLEGEGHFLGQTIQANFVIPYTDDGPFKLSLQTKELDPTPLLASLVDNPGRSEFQAAITSQTELTSARGGFWNSSGTITIDKLLLRRSNMQLANREPALIRVHEGQFDVDHLNLEGENAFFRVSSNHPAKRKLDLSLNTNTDLAFLQILTPFLTDLRGQASATCQIRGDASGIDLLGSALIEKAVLKFKQFPHAFTNLKTDILFNQRKIVFNTIAADLAGGQLTGEGDLEMKGYKNFPARFNFHLGNAELNVPENVRSKGDADLQLTGTWFPYLLRGTYSVHGGLMSREFAPGSGSEGTIRQSSYLPKVVSQDVFSPLAFNISIDIANTYQVRNSLADTAVAGQLVLGGTAQAPTLKGVISPQKGGKVLNHDTEFEITTGTVRFSEAKPTDPEIFLTAATRVQTFDINLLVQGTAQKPDIKLSSQPSMTQQEIVSLLALGITPASYQTDPTHNEGKESAGSGARIGSALLGDSPIKKEITQKTGFQLDLSTTNPLKMATFAPTDDTISEPKITVSRQWTPKFGASASRTVGDVQLSDVKVKYQLNHEVSLVGRWEDREIDPAAVQSLQATQNVGGLNSSSLFGLDLEYKLEFK